MNDPQYVVVLSCEHASNAVPDAYGQLFRNHRGLLPTHRGYDPGSLLLAEHLAAAFQAPLTRGEVTRLLVDLNRSRDNPTLFAPFVMKHTTEAEREAILARYYTPYWKQVQGHIESGIARGCRVVHLSLHSFTPVLKGSKRKTHVGLLFDPKRPGELALCTAWQRHLQTALPRLVIAHNDPYRGDVDGLTTACRRIYPPELYIGIEIEVVQRIARRDDATYQRVRQAITSTLQSCLDDNVVG